MITRHYVNRLHQSLPFSYLSTINLCTVKESHWLLQVVLYITLGRHVAKVGLASPYCFNCRLQRAVELFDK